MIFDGTLSYLFNTGNNSGLIKNNINQVYMGDCTILCRFKPDIEKMTKEMPEIGFLSTGIICKNGMHIGIFFKMIEIILEMNLGYIGLVLNIGKKTKKNREY